MVADDCTKLSMICPEFCLFTFIFSFFFIPCHILNILVIKYLYAYFMTLQSLLSVLNVLPYVEINTMRLIRALLWIAIHFHIFHIAPCRFLKNAFLRMHWRSFAIEGRCLWWKASKERYKWTDLTWLPWMLYQYVFNAFYL